MPYFPVDDQFAFHPKTIAAGNASVGVWTRCGSWSKSHATGGFVPYEVAHAIGTKTELARLVRSGLWHEVPGGYQFHDWDHQAGNFDADEEKARREVIREKDRDRKRVQREREKSERSRVDSGRDMSHVPPPVTDGIPSTPSPVPSPRTKDTQISPVPYAESYPQDGPIDPSGVDFRKVKTAAMTHCGRSISDMTANMIVGTILTKADRAKANVKSSTGYVVAAIRNDPFVWQKFIDDFAVSGSSVVVS